MASNQVLKIREETPSINNTTRMSYPNYCMYDHGIVEIQKEDKLLICWEFCYVYPVKIL